MRPLLSPDLSPLTSIFYNEEVQDAYSLGDIQL